jgi:hypothetical protein
LAGAVDTNKPPQPAAAPIAETGEPGAPTDTHAVTTPKPGLRPEPSPTPTAEPGPETKPQPENAKPATESPPPTREEVAALARALAAARAALTNGKPEIARRELQKAKDLPKLPEHNAKFARLMLLTDYAKNFRSALGEALSQFKVGDQIPVGKSTMAGVVSASADKLTIRLAGENRTFTVDQLPAGLVLAIADASPRKDDPVALVLKATYLATLKGANADQLSTAREWFQQAAQKGADVGDLAKVLDDKYDLESDLK